MAMSKLAPQPVAFYAAVFLLVNTTYIFLIWELIGRTPEGDVSPRVRRTMRYPESAFGKAQARHWPERRADEILCACWLSLNTGTSGTRATRQSPRTDHACVCYVEAPWLAEGECCHVPPNRTGDAPLLGKIETTTARSLKRAGVTSPK
jgi:DNA-binding IclR family transcriptional regulator